MFIQRLMSLPSTLMFFLLSGHHDCVLLTKKKNANLIIGGKKITNVDLLQLYDPDSFFEPVMSCIHLLKDP